MTCRTCHTDAKHSDRTGCCSSCGRLFKGLGAFDAHWVTPAPGERACVDPLGLETGSGQPRYETVDVPGGVAYRFRTDSDRWDRKAECDNCDSTTDVDAASGLCPTCLYTTEGAAS